MAREPPVGRPDIRESQKLLRFLNVTVLEIRI